MRYSDYLNISFIIQWNIRGLQANREELSILLSNYDPDIVYLQETFVKENKSVTIKNCIPFHQHASDINGIAHGGNSIHIKPSIPHS